MVVNEAHAWVEVHDGMQWRRIDLGGAGRMVTSPSSTLPERAVYRPPPDAFAWPQSAQRGDDMVAEARSRTAAQEPGSAPAEPSGEGDTAGLRDRAASSRPAGGAAPSAGASAASSQPGEPDERPSAVVSLAVTDANAHRGLPLHVSGAVRADGEPCAHAAVELWLRDAKTARMVQLGTVATGEDGAFADGIVVPAGTPLGDYDVIARSHGDARCGDGKSN
jgi:hypothetical protein